MTSKISPTVKNCRNFGAWGKKMTPLGNFWSVETQRHFLAWNRVEWAIARENWSSSVTYGRALASEKMVSIHCHCTCVFHTHAQRPLADGFWCYLACQLMLMTQSIVQNFVSVGQRVPDFWWSENRCSHRKAKSSATQCLALPHLHVMMYSILSFLMLQTPSIRFIMLNCFHVCLITFFQLCL
jgi:hypothetical protein